MNFELSASQKALQENVREFAQKELLPGVIERDENSEFPIDQYKKMGQMGLMSIPYPKEFGGQGLGYQEYALVIEEISKVDASMGIAYSVSASLYGGSVYGSDASDALKKKVMEKVLKGESLGAFALTEATAGSDASGIQTTAVLDGDDYILNGTKIFNTNGPLADYYAVYALTSPEKGQRGLSAFVVPRDTEGLKIGKIENKMGIKAAQVSEVIFENVRIPKEYKLTDEETGFKLAMKTLDNGRIGVAAQGLGIAQGAFDITVEYLKEREQFGKPLSKNQYIQFKMAELQMEIEAARLMLYKAASDHDIGRPYTLSAAKAKYLCTNAAMKVTTEAVQLLGGNGYMKEYHVERMMRDAKITQIYEGTNEIQKLIVGGSIFR